MRKLLATTVCSLALLWAAPAAAQSAGIKAGRIQAEFDGDTGTPGNTFERRGDWTAGLFLRFGLGPLGFQMEGLYSKRGAKVEGVAPAEFDMTYVEVPLTLRIGSGATALYGGGYGAVKLDAKVIEPAGELDISSDVEELDYGVLFGIGIGLGKLELDGRYVIGLADLLKSPAAPEIKHRALVFTAGFRF